ncbi:MAG: hypothetical protein RL678_1671 [Pseudomonadota bacterium]|jgi:hypothetical protein
MTNKQHFVRHPSVDFTGTDRRFGVTAQRCAVSVPEHLQLISLIKESVNEHIDAKAAVLPRG